MTASEACTLLAETTAALGHARRGAAFYRFLAERMAARLHAVAAERNRYKRKYFDLIDAQRIRSQVKSSLDLPERVPGQDGAPLEQGPTAWH